MASAQSLGAYFGGISGAGITMRYKRKFERASRFRRLKGKVKKIRSQIVNISDLTLPTHGRSYFKNLTILEN